MFYIQNGNLINISFIKEKKRMFYIEKWEYYQHFLYKGKKKRMFDCDEKKYVCHSKMGIVSSSYKGKLF